MKYFAISILVFFLPSFVDAGGFEEAIGTASLAYFKTIKSLEFKASATGSIEGSPQSNLAKDLAYQTRGDCVKFEFSQDGTLSSGPVKASGSYNGDLYQVLNLPLLKIKKGWPDSISSLYQNDFFFTPFAFADLIAAKPKQEAVLRLSDYQSQELWKKIGGETLEVDKKASAVECVFKGIYYGRNVLMRVRFDAVRGFFPVYWERLEIGRQEDDKVGYSFRAEELEKIPGQELFYAKRATLVQHMGRGRPVFKSEVQISDIKINHLTEDDDRFTIDPSIVDHVYDLDEKVTITIPK